MEARLILTTFASHAKADSVAGELIEKRVAACINIVAGVTSIYRWEGAVQRDEEVLCIIKTTEAKLAACRELLLSLHPYDVPELVVIEPVAVADSYLQWLIASTNE